MYESLPGASPNHSIARSWNQIAFAYESMGELEDAHLAYQNAIEIGSGSVSIQELTNWQEDLQRLEAIME